MTEGWSAAASEGPAGPAPLLLVCEHASNHFPAEWGDLGLSPEIRQSHIAWDPGALALTRMLAARLAAPLVAGGISRLIYDCNRPPEAPDAIPVRSEIFEVPGNRDLSAAARARRVDAVYRPFTAAVERAIQVHRPQALVTVHSFTPVYFGKRREVQVGILHDADTRLADLLLAAGRGGLDWRRNEPYGPTDGVTHTLRRHALPEGLPNAMIEIRNDLLSDEEAVARIASLLAPAIARALDAVQAREAS